MGSTNGVQPSWRLATITMHTMPSPSCRQRTRRRVVRGATIATADTIANLDTEKCPKQNRNGGLRYGGAHRPGGSGHGSGAVGGAAAKGLAHGMLDQRLEFGSELGKVGPDRTLAALKWLPVVVEVGKVHANGQRPPLDMLEAIVLEQGRQAVGQHQGRREQAITGGAGIGIEDGSGIPKQ